jgi:hypothetical protein
MQKWTPDQTFYPSPKMAMEAPPETLGYLALLDRAHGAGLMVVPLVLGLGAATAGAAMCHTSAAAGTGVSTSAVSMGTAAHGMGYLAVTAAAAVVVYEKVGVGILRTAWINLDLLWAIALIAAGVLTIAL